MAIELHLCKGGDFRTTTDFLECGNCSAIIPNTPNDRETVRCGTCGEEQDTSDLADALVSAIVKAVVDAENFRGILRLALADLETAATWSGHPTFTETILAARAALGEE